MVKKFLISVLKNELEADKSVEPNLELNLKPETGLYTISYSPEYLKISYLIEADSLWITPPINRWLAVWTNSGLVEIIVFFITWSAFSIDICICLPGKSIPSIYDSYEIKSELFNNNSLKLANDRFLNKFKK